MSGDLLRLAHIAYPVTALGPGHRLALWVAGCPLDCNGCITPELQSLTAGKAISIESLAQRILALKPALDGVTFTGGEPFAQASALAQLWEQLAQLRPQWDLMVFSGFTLAQLRANPGASILLKATDILVDGPYLAGSPAVKPLLASANQQIHYLTELAKMHRYECGARSCKQVNLGLNRDGKGWLIGILGVDERKQVHGQLGLSPASRGM